MSSEIVVEIIKGLFAIAVSVVSCIGAFQMSIKKDREAQRKDLKAELLTYHNQNREEIRKIQEGDLREIRDDLTDMGANIQQKLSDLDTRLALVENNLNLYSQKVDKHNSVIERTYALEARQSRLEQAVADLKDN